MSTTIQLKSSHGVIIQVDMEDVKCSKTIMALLEKREGGEPVNLASMRMDSRVLKKVLEWTKHHKGDPNPTHVEGASVGGATAMVIGDWDAAYLERQTPGDLFELVIASDKLKIERLVKLTSEKVASMIRGQSPEQIRNNFGIKNDFTQEEEEKILRENEHLLR